MNSSRNIARITGILFIIGTVTGLLTTSFTASTLDAPDYLQRISANGNQIMMGALFAFISSFASTGIAISLYPILKKHNEALALGAVSFRIIEGVFHLVSVISMLLLLLLSQEFVKAGAPDASAFQILGTLLLGVSDLVYFVFLVSAFSLGALMYYAVLYQSRLLPRWLAGWGFIAAALALSAAVLMMFGEKPLSPLMLSLILPIFVQEIVVAGWLIIKGFNASAIVSLAVKREMSSLQ